MTLLKKVTGQDRVEGLLGRSLSGGRLAHAYLFAGPSGTGRLTAALELSAALMCESEPAAGYCGECRECTRVFTFTHPDVRLTIPQTADTTPEEIASLLQTRAADGISAVRLEGNTRTAIEQVRELQDRISRKAFEDRGHVEIILDADRMGVEAANALLKTLEEPPDETVIVLTSSRWSALLPTIRSRTHLIRFGRLRPELIEEMLLRRLTVDRATAKVLAGTCDGRPGLALDRAMISASGDDRYSPEAVLRRLKECGSPSGALSLALEVSRRLQRGGCIELCRGMRAYLHDLRRDGLGMEPVSRPVERNGFPKADDESCLMAAELFLKAEERLEGNGMPMVVMGAAFIGTLKALPGN